MNLHLKEISTQVTQGAHAVVILDGAGWHQQGDKLKVPDNISLLPLPPYSPELNPQENIWQFLRQNYLANRVYDTYAELVDACCEPGMPSSQPHSGNFHRFKRMGETGHCVGPLV
jgi:transposase